MTDFNHATLEDLITHEDLLEKHMWLTSHVVSRWRRDRKIRFLRGRKGAYIYPKADIDLAINEELQCGESEEVEASLNTETNGSVRSPAGPATIDTGTKTEADALKDALSRHAIFNPPRKSSSSSSAPRQNARTARSASASLMS